MKGRTIVVAAAALALALLAGCGGQASQPSNAITIALPRLGFLVPNPLRESAGSMDYLTLMYDTLVGKNADGTLSTTSGIAQRWQMAADGLSWTFDIRHGARFHDGVEVTAADAKFSMEAAMGPTSRSTFASEMRETIKSIEATDPYTLTVRCNHRCLDLPEFYSNRSGIVLPKHYYEQVGDDQFGKKPIGSGPYKFVSGMQSSEITLDAVDGHWRGGTPRFRQVIFKVIAEESTSLAMLVAGSADITIVSRDKVKQVVDSGLKVIDKKNAAIVTFRPNMQWTSPAFSDIRFRKALSLAVDRDSIVKNIFDGRATPAITWPGSVINVVGQVPRLRPYPYDPAEAKRLIAESGFDGYQFRIPSYPRASTPEFRRLVETVAGYWEQVGLRPTIYNTDFVAFQAAWRAGKTQGIIMGSDGVTDPSPFEILKAMRLYLHSSSSRTIVHDATIDGMLDTAEASLDHAAIDRTLSDIYQRLYDQYYFIPICEADEIIATTPRIPAWDPGQLNQEHNFEALLRP